jgi:hypothetical protein
MGQFGGIRQRRLDVAGLKRRIAVKDVFPAGSLSKAIEDDGDKNPRAFSA